MRNLKVLIFPAGTEIGLEIWRSLKDVKNIRLYGANSAVSDPTGKKIFEQSKEDFNSTVLKKYL